MAKKTIKQFTREDFVSWGKKSGDKNKVKGKDYFSKIGSAGAKKRWAGHIKKITKK